MSLYRTWRPRSFADLVGQDAVVRTLSTALATGRLAHAYLFSGPRGSGKTSAAKILARCVECVNGPTATPDNTCENCRAIFEGTALDVLEIDAASNRGIDEIRSLRESVKFAPSVMRSKVYIIDEVHMLTKEGANAFLKTLEEPPSHAIFILATTNPEALPPTILSRCQRYAFRRISIPTMIERMREIAAAESITIDDAALGAIAYRADGGLRDALTMLEQVAAYGGNQVSLGTVEAAFGTTGRVRAEALVGQMLAGDAAGAVRTIEHASDEGADMQGLIRGTIAELRHLLVGRIDPALLDRDLSTDDAARIAALAAGTAQVRVVRALRLCMDSLTAARASGNARLELETAVLRYIFAHEDPSLDALATRVALLEGHAPAAAPALSALAHATAPVAPSVPIPPNPAAPPPVPAPPTTAPATAMAPTPAPEPAPVVLGLQRLEHHWPAVLERVGKQKPTVMGHLKRARLTAFDGSTLTITVPDQITLQMVTGALGLIGQTLADTTGVGLRITTVVAAGDEGDDADDAGDIDPDDLLGYASRKLR